jgi:hypothetical protein
MTAALSPVLAKCAAPAFSQAAEKSAGEELETAVVTAIRSSLANSLEAKCESQTVVDVLISGVSIAREFSERERVSILPV